MKTYVHTETCTQIFTAALFIITNSWQQLRYSQGFPWRRQWHLTPVLLHGKSHGRRSLVGCVHGVAKSWTWLSEFPFTFNFHALEKEMATHSSTLAWKIPWAIIHGVAKSWTWLSEFTFTFNRWMAKQTVVHWYNGILFSHRMQWAIKPQKIEEYLAYC